MTKIDHICCQAVTHCTYTQSSHPCPAEVVEEGLYEEVISVLTWGGGAEIIHKDKRIKEVLGRMLPYTNKADATEQDASQEPQTLP